jgi:hypothetical protein
MTVEVIKSWTCDVCGLQEDFGATVNRTPVNWVCVAVNTTAPDASWDHPDWTRFHLCDGCVENPTVNVRYLLGKES